MIPVTTLMGVTISAWMLAAGAKYAMAALAIYVVRKLRTTRPRVWWAVVAGEVLPANALILESINVVYPLGAWFYPLLGAHAVAMAGCAAAAWAVVSERVADGMPPVSVGITEAERAQMEEVAERRAMSKLLAKAFVTRAENYQEA